MLSNELVGCKQCGFSCQKAGEANNEGEIKVFCCPCYAKTDDSFTKEKWCIVCRNNCVLCIFFPSCIENELDGVFVGEGKRCENG
jgi:hypothetical protein